MTFRLRDSHTLRSTFPCRSATSLQSYSAVHTPYILLHTVSPTPLSLATTRRISVDFFSSGYLDVSVPRVPHVTLWIHVTFHGYSPWGFPHSEIHGSKLICSSPWLIAACRVLLRLLMPRHSPCALFRLNFPRSFDLAVLSLNCLSFIKTNSFRDPYCS